jgi:ABC-type transporter Mla maintaining outer membrane lipid asymmetry permease subunit MlaE
MKYLVVPRFVASTIMMFFTVLGMLIGISGGYFVGSGAQHQPGHLCEQSIDTRSRHMVRAGQALVFGAVVGLIGCYKDSIPEGAKEWARQRPGP